MSGGDYAGPCTDPHFNRAGLCVCGCGRCTQFDWCCCLDCPCDCMGDRGDEHCPDDCGELVTGDRVIGIVHPRLARDSATGPATHFGTYVTPASPLPVRNAPQEIPEAFRRRPPA